MAHLQLKNFVYWRNGPLSLHLHPGECVSLSGASGSGKSLLLRAIADLDPHSGALLLDGENSQQMPAHLWRRKIALLPAESHWWLERVEQHFAPTTPVALPPLLAALNLPLDILHWPVARLSSGERQRLGLVRALAQQPSVLLLDEPTANLDPDNAQKVEQLLCNHRQQQIALLWVSHDAAQRQRVAQRHLLLHEGNLHSLSA